MIQTDDTKMVKISSCNKCGGIIRGAVSEYLSKDTKARNEFMKEAMKYNLNISEITLQEYRNKQFGCTCNNSKSTKQ